MGAWRMLAQPNPHTPHMDPRFAPPPPFGLEGFKALSQDEPPRDNDMDSEANSEHEPVEDIENDKLESSHREILEKLKRQEEEEREEIERELREVEKSSTKGEDEEEGNGEEIKAHDLRAQDINLNHEHDRENGVKDNSEPTQTEIRSQRPPGLLAQHGLSAKIDRDKEIREREKEKEREKERDRDILNHRDRMIPLDFTHPAFMPLGAPDRSPFSHSPTSATPPGMEPMGGSPGHHWTFEEQFKQLYELSDDLKRREFLDDLFAYMQRRGTPVNRIPIMAKQPLDLYELFRLVVSKGGLVEVINKKLWREICKGLNLPSSITSAAFTLRTQYMKYLYPYECEKLKLSNPAELQAAIDGNRREGRRPSYGYDFSPIPTMMPPTPHLNGAHIMNGLGRPPTDDDTSIPCSTPPTHLRTMAERDARAMEAAQRAMEEATKRIEEASRGMVTTCAPTITAPTVTPKTDLEPPPAKRRAIEEERERFERFMVPHLGMPSAHFKITSRSDGRSEYDSSLVVSMEINGIMYQGVLFAQHPRRI